MIRWSIINLIAVLISLLLIAVIQTAALHDSPDEEMQKFIDECHYMADMMQHCADGWLDFEQEIIDSVDSFADRIVYTEGLIMDEADQILIMADRIVETEELMFDVLDSCSCLIDSSLSTMTNASCHNAASCKEKRRLCGYSHQPLKSTSMKSSSQQLESTVSSDCGKIESLPLNRTISIQSLQRVSDHHEQQQQSDERCEPMDQLIEVMDSVIDTFVVFNDDFLEVLSYMDQGIQDMGDRIVDTECLIMNMSVQIGVMADRIVETEYLAANMTTSCCTSSDAIEAERHLRGHEGRIHSVRSDLIQKSDDVYQLRRDAWTTLRSSHHKSVVSEGGDDDLMPHCNDSMINDPKRSALDITVQQRIKQLLRKSVVNVQEKLTLQKEQLRRVSANDENSNSSVTDGPMPCDTWWNPFCCAAEMCADMMAMMIEMMGGGADAMTEICEDVIDEIGKLADDIVHTEENIVLMGEEIGYMSDCIVVFIDQGFDFMEEFCPLASNYYSTPVSTLLRDDACSTGSQIERVRSIAATESTTTDKSLLRAKLTDSLSASKTYNKYFRTVLSKNKEIMMNYDVLMKNGGNPFKDFAEMFEAMFEMMAVGANMMEGQINIMGDMFNDLLDLGDEQHQLDGMVVDMSGDVVSLSSEVETSEGLMQQLNSCMSSTSK